MSTILGEVNFRLERSGENLIIAIAQDHETNEVLMVAFMNREALEKTLANGTMYYFSTSRKKIWHKGEESGHMQFVKEVKIDCDGDALLFKVEQKGAACHKGFYSCFFRKVSDEKLEVEGEKVFNPDDVY